jgi:hypothetical protein
VLDLTHIGQARFKRIREWVNSGVHIVGVKTITVDGRLQTVTVYSPGIAEDGHLGRIPDPRKPIQEEQEDE